MIGDAINQTEQAAHDVTTMAEETTETIADAATSAAESIEEGTSNAAESATTAVQESAAAASTLASTTAKTVTDKASSMATSAKTSVTEASTKVADTSSSAVKATTEKVAEAKAVVTEKAAETKAAVTSKIAAAAPAAAAGNNKVEMLELAKKSGCLSCHSIEKKIVGPAWRDVAAKYRGQSDAKTNIINSIANGSTGKWGTFAMPANSPRVSDENIATLAGFVLSLE